MFSSENLDKGSQYQRDMINIGRPAHADLGDLRRIKSMVLRIEIKPRVTKMLENSATSSKIAINSLFAVLYYFKVAKLRAPLNLLVEKGEPHLMLPRRKRRINLHVVDVPIYSDFRVDLPAHVLAIDLHEQVAAGCHPAHTDLEKVSGVGAGRGKSLAPALRRVQQRPGVCLYRHVGALDVRLSRRVSVPLRPGNLISGLGRVDAAVDSASVIFFTDIYDGMA